MTRFGAKLFKLILCHRVSIGIMPISLQADLVSNGFYRVGFQKSFQVGSFHEYAPSYFLRSQFSLRMYSRMVDVPSREVSAACLIVRKDVAEETFWIEANMVRSHRL
jgi:hypothetical protein